MNDPATEQPKVEDFADMPVGEILRRTREHYGQTIEEVESFLRIRAVQLQALEDGDHSKLPGRVYAIGFVRSYAEYLGLEGDKMVRLFKAQSVGGEIRPELNFPASASETKGPNAYGVLGSLIGSVLVLAVWVVVYAPKKQEVVIPPVPPKLKTQTQKMPQPELVEGELILEKKPPEEVTAEESLEPEQEKLAESEIPAQPEEQLNAPLEEPEPVIIVSEETAETAAPEMEEEELIPPEPIAPRKPRSRVVLEITDNSWVEIQDDNGKVLLRRVLKPGDEYMVPNEKGISMATGNAGGITVYVDGKEIGPVGPRAQVRRSISLDPEDWLKRRR